MDTTLQMDRSTRGISGTLFGLMMILVIFVPVPARAQMTSDPGIRNELDRILQSRQQLDGHVGLVSAVAFPDGTIWEGASGWSDPGTGDPIRTDHRLAFASITKTFVAAVVLQLVEEGVLTLDDTVGQHAGPFTFVNSGITIRQLLGHTSGVYNYTNHPERVATLRADLSRVWTPEEVLAHFLKSPLYFAGTGASYSNSNFLILHTIVEAATGNTLGDEIRARIIGPLALGGTTFGGDEPPNGEVPTTWSDINGDGELDSFNQLYVARSHLSARAAPGSMFSTASDIARWAQHLFNPSTFSASVRDEMLDWHALDGVNDTWTGFGLSVQQFRFAGVEMWGHSGWVNGSRSIMAYAPNYGFSFAVVDNDARSNHYEIAHELAGYLATLDLTSTGLEEHPGYKTELDIYPNPAPRGADVTIQGEAGGRQGRAGGRLVMVDMLGRTVLQVSLGKGVFNLGGVAPGTYFIRVQRGADVSSRILVVQ